MPALFISHSSRDKNLAYGLKREVEGWGYSCFLDFQGIPGGTEWEEEVYRAMRGATAVLLCATPEAMRSRFSDLGGLLQARTQLLGVMGRAALRDVISRPAGLAGVRFQDGLVEEILDDTEGGDALPLLAHLLERLWQEARERVAAGPLELTRELYRSVGRVQGALADRADAILRECSDDEREPLRTALIDLADVNERGDFTRRRALLEALPAAAHPLLRSFVDARLLAAGQDAEGRPWVEVAHEALLRGWPPLRGWLEAASDRMRLRRELEQDVAAWEKSKRSPAYLWRRERLAAAQELAEAESWAEDDPRREFLLQAEIDDRRERERESVLLAERVLTDYEADPERGILLALAAIEEYGWSSRAELALNTALDGSRLRGRFEGHEGAVLHAAFSPDGTRVLTASDDGSARLWSLLDDASLLVFARSRCYRDLTPEERTRYGLPTTGVAN